jgi:hypothetical protein
MATQSTVLMERATTLYACAALAVVVWVGMLLVLDVLSLEETVGCCLRWKAETVSFAAEY